MNERVCEWVCACRCVCVCIIAHLVGFVEHGKAAPARKVEGVLLQVVLDAPWGAHHHVHACAEALKLWGVGRAAVQAQNHETRAHALDLAGNLLGQLAGGGKDHGSWSAPTLTLASTSLPLKHLSNWERKSERFPLPSSCPSNHVCATSDEAKSLGLNLKKLIDPTTRKRFHSSAAQVKVAD
jgi:hypothetical protein